MSGNPTDFAKDSRYVIATRFHGNLLVSDKYTQEDLERDLEKLGNDFPEIYDYDSFDPFNTIYKYRQ
jgi:hypothetical protein